MEILRCENLTKKYGSGETEITALDNVSFTVDKGEFISVIGPSGSGKSTLLHILGGVDKPTSGKVFIDGTDMHWLREAMMNLVKNCIEHTDEGGNVKISAEQNNIFTCLTVEDNGSGIGEKDLSHIFERFYKAENASAQSVGIGLSLAKQIISAHNGTLSADSILREGTRFTLKLYRMGISDRI